MGNFTVEKIKCQALLILSFRVVNPVYTVCIAFYAEDVNPLYDE